VKFLGRDDIKILDLLPQRFDLRAAPARVLSRAAADLPIQADHAITVP